MDVYYHLILSANYFYTIYAVVKCLPMLSNQQILEDHLNLTNDCPGFITHIHSLFMKSSSH